MAVCRHFIWLIVYSFFGWIWESIYCTITKKHWDPRGFMFGPVCPIYGVGAVLITIVAEALQARGISDYAWWQIFLIGFFGSIVLEYVTHYLLEKIFHAYWWDYRNMPLNIHGRVCFPASCLFGAAGVVVVYFGMPFMDWLTRDLPENLIGFAALLLTAVFFGDLMLTVSALTDFEVQVSMLDEAINQHMTDFVEDLKVSMQDAKADLEQKLQEEQSAFKEHIQAERARFEKLRIEQTAHSYGSVRRAAVARIKDFNEANDQHGRHHHVLEALKKHRRGDCEEK